jgi:hypothetical protein
MGHKFLLPEQADSWGEFHARLEIELASRDDDLRLRPLWWSVGGLLFGVTLMTCAYATQDHHWWLWICMVAALAADIALAIRALDHTEYEHARMAELNRMQDLWEQHMDRGPAT